MFQETAHNADNLDIFRVSFHLRDQTTDSTDDHLDFYAGLGSLYQFVDDHFVGKRVDLDSDIAFFPVFHVVYLFIDHITDFILQTFWCHQQIIGLLYGFAF